MNKNIQMSSSTVSEELLVSRVVSQIVKRISGETFKQECRYEHEEMKKQIKKLGGQVQRLKDQIAAFCTGKVSGQDLLKAIGGASDYGMMEQSRDANMKLKAVTMPRYQQISQQLQQRSQSAYVLKQNCKDQRKNQLIREQKIDRSFRGQSSVNIRMSYDTSSRHSEYFVKVTNQAQKVASIEHSKVQGEYFAESKQRQQKVRIKTDKQMAEQRPGPTERDSMIYTKSKEENIAKLKDQIKDMAASMRKGKARQSSQPQRRQQVQQSQFRWPFTKSETETLAKFLPIQPHQLMNQLERSTKSLQLQKIQSNKEDLKQSIGRTANRASQLLKSSNKNEEQSQSSFINMSKH